MRRFRLLVAGVIVSASGALLLAVVVSITGVKAFLWIMAASWAIVWAVDTVFKWLVGRAE